LSGSFPKLGFPGVSAASAGGSQPCWEEKPLVAHSPAAETKKLSIKKIHLNVSQIQPIIN
jgi:hypothetical protein